MWPTQMTRTVLRLAKTLDRKCRSPLNGRLDRSWSSVTRAALTKASTSNGSARTSFGSPAGYGTGAGQVPERESTGKTFRGDFGSGSTGIFKERSTVHALAEAVTFDNSIDARSASVAWKFCACHLSATLPCEVKQTHKSSGYNELHESGF